MVSFRGRAAPATCLQAGTRSEMPADPIDRRARRTPRRRVALLGFSDFERDALASYFRLAGADGGIGYRPGRDPARCDFIVAVSDHPATVQAIVEAGREADTVFVGRRPPEGAGAWLRRPIEPMRIVRELDGIVSQQQMMITVPDALDEARPRRPVAAPPRIDTADPAAVPLPSRPMPATAAGHAPATDVAPRRTARRFALVVESRAAVLAGIAMQLEARGYDVTTAHGGEAALEAVAAAPVDLAFVDAALGAAGALDGYETCQRLRRRHGGEACRIVLVGGAADPSDRVRAMIAGCNAQAALPLDDDSLDEVLRRLG